MRPAALPALLLVWLAASAAASPGVWLAASAAASPGPAGAVELGTDRRVLVLEPGASHYRVLGILDVLEDPERSLSIADGGDPVWIHVADTGRGVPPAMRQRIFESYAQLDSRSAPAREGLGLGLAIVRRLADLLGHRLTISDNEGGGSIFSLGIERGRASEVRQREGAAVHGFGGARILLVDSDPGTRAGLCELLESWDCGVVAAPSPSTARSSVGSAPGPPAVVLADPSGSDAGSGVAEVAALCREQGVPGIWLSGDSSQAAEQEARRRGLILLRKPVAPARLRAALQHAITSAAGGRD